MSNHVAKIIFQLIITSLSKLAFVNSNEFNNALVAANLTWLLYKDKTISLRKAL